MRTAASRSAKTYESWAITVGKFKDHAKVGKIGRRLMIHQGLLQRTLKIPGIIPIGSSDPSERVAV